MDFRPAPPAAPPAYSTISRFTGNRSLRAPVLLFTVGGFIWSLLVGIDYVRDSRRDGLSSRLSTVLLVQGILFFVLASLETFGFYAAWRCKPNLGKFYVIAVITGGILVFVVETMRLVLHFVFKSDIQAYCFYVNQSDTLDFSSNADVQAWCSKDWTNGIWRDVAWLVFGAVCSVLMYFLSKAYYHQLLDPNFGRTTAAASERYRMNEMNVEQTQAPYNTDNTYAPPYGYNPPPQPPAGYAPPAAPPSYHNEAPAYSTEEKGGFTSSDVKEAPNDCEHGLQSHVESPNAPDSMLPGRQGEGRI